MGKNGFSIVEILVVIGIIAVLMSLGLAVGRRARETARATQCMANQRQLLVALVAYDSDCGTLPFGNLLYSPMTEVDREDRAGTGIDSLSQWWFQFILERKHSRWCEPVLECPSKSQPDLIVGDRNVLCSNYGVNRSLCRTLDDSPFYEPFLGRPASLTRLRQPGETLLLCDSGYSLVSWWHALAQPLELTPPTNYYAYREARSYIPGLLANSSRTDIREFFPVMLDDAIRGRHANKTVNVTFCDGHVARTPAEDLRVDMDGDEYINRSPLWVPR